MRDGDKDKEQPQNELTDLRKKIVELEEIKNPPKNAKKQLKKSEQIYNLIFKNSSDIIAVTTFSLNPVYIYINPSIKNIGYQQEELLGKSPFDFIHPDDRKKLFPLLKKYMNAKVKKLLTGKEPIITERIEYRFKDKDGNWRNFQTTGSIVGNQLLFIARDITGQKKTEEALQESQQEFASLFKSNPEALVHTDEKGTVLNINPRFTELFGYALEELKGRNIDEGMIHPAGKLKEGKKITKVGLGGYIYHETIRKKKDGTLFPVLISASSVIVEGKYQGAIALYQDITERKQHEQMQTALYNISKAANSPITLEQLYQTIHQELGTLIDTTNFYIALLDEKKDQVFFPYNIDNTKPIHLPRTINHNSLVAQVIKTGKSIFVNQEMIKGKKFMEEFKELFGMLRKVWLGVPLKVEDRVIGALCVQSYSNPKLYSEGDIKLLEFVSFQVATAIERKSTEEKIRHLSFHDPLTDLYNRAYFEEELKRYNFPRYFPLSIISIDVNGLKVINDTFGHQEGDKLLQHFASLLTSTSRKGDVIARMGGDEFTLLLPSTTAAQAQEVCERIKQSCKEDNIEPIYLRSSVSLGHATQEGAYSEMENLLKEADDKMYQDKLFRSRS